LEPSMLKRSSVRLVRRDKSTCNSAVVKAAGEDVRSGWCPWLL
jgi:hypothetical protein